MTNQPEPRIAVIPFSLRSASANRGLARAATELAAENFELLLADDLPLFSEDHEVPGAEPSIASARDFRHAIRSAPALLLCTPEYDAYPPGMLINAFNWLSREPDPPLKGKPVAVAGAAAGFRGSRRSQAHVRQLLETIGARPIEQHYYVQIGDRFNSSGDLVDPDERARFNSFLVSVSESN